MAFSDLVVVRYLVQATETTVNPILWREMDDGGYQGDLNQVRIELREVRGRLFVSLSHQEEQVHIAQPISTSFFRRTYKDSEEAELVGSMQTLGLLAARQCIARRRRAAEHEEEARQAIYRRLVFGNE